MANHPSAKKRNRQTVKRRLRNRVTRGHMRTAIKAAYKAIGEGKKDQTGALTKEAVRLIDRAYSKGVIKRNTASHLISKLTRQTGA
ncbi:MAG: 30S ribosomal protein S20 [Deltaproteobacteria bacterium]|nr:30S ribosomal protein S20 [Deltaproteobacteria bacterium]